MYGVVAAVNLVSRFERDQEERGSGAGEGASAGTNRAIADHT